MTEVHPAATPFVPPAPCAEELATALGIARAQLETAQRLAASAQAHAAEWARLAGSVSARLERLRARASRVCQGVVLCAADVRTLVVEYLSCRECWGHGTVDGAPGPCSDCEGTGVAL